jgi:hypothetical protein
LRSTNPLWIRVSYLATRASRSICDLERAQYRTARADRSSTVPEEMSQKKRSPARLYNHAAWPRFSPDGKKVVLTSSQVMTFSTLRRQGRGLGTRTNFDGTPSPPVTTGPINKIEAYYGQGLTISPDGKTALWSAGISVNRDLMLIENFQ